ncbi:hypothetical protein HOB30_00155, partial [Candidatus Falkowbacteria bacterium]|nr:hypothetical protein [Candidatus Falkowbacteria bacterium]
MKKQIMILGLLLLATMGFAQTQFSLNTSTFNGIDIGSYSKPTFIDLDNDGLLDMLVGEESGNINHYEQDYSNSSSFSLITDSFNSIDVGSHSAPTFADLDDDGLLDMLIGKDNGRIYHYEQDEINSLSFTLITEYFNSIDVGDYSAPTFTDIDGDGLLDLLVGENDGNINHYEQNIVTPTTFDYITSSFNGIDIGYRSTPTFADLDDDGLLDMLVGEESGNINHYEQD